MRRKRGDMESSPTADEPAEQHRARARAQAADAASDAVQSVSDAVGEAAADATAEPKGEPTGPLGSPGAPLNRHSPFYMGFVGAVGVMIAIGLVHVVSRLSPVLTLIVVALFLALGLDPVVQWVQARGMRRGYAVLVVFTGVLLVFVGIIALLVPPVVQEATQLAAQAPDFVHNLLRSDTVRKLDNQYHIVSRVQAELQKRVASQTLWTSVFGGVLGAGKAVVSGLFSVLTVLILTLYFTASLPRVKAAVYRMAPRTRRQRVSYLAEEISHRVGGYLIGQVTVATINGVCSFVMMKIVGVPYSAVLAVSVGILGLIPMVGATLGALLVGLVALFQSGTSAIIVGIYYVVYQQVENYVIAPRVMQRTVAVPGAVTVVAALAGGTLLGVLGALLAIPVAAGLLLLYQEVLLPRQQAA